MKAYFFLVEDFPPPPPPPKFGPWLVLVIDGSLEIAAETGLWWWRDDPVLPSPELATLLCLLELLSRFENLPPISHLLSVKPTKHGYKGAQKIKYYFTISSK